MPESLEPVSKLAGPEGVGRSQVGRYIQDNHRTMRRTTIRNRQTVTQRTGTANQNGGSARVLDNPPVSLNVMLE